MHAQPALDLDLSGPSSSEWTRGPDLLRLERFGALHYRRADARFVPLPPAEARALVESARTGISALEIAAGGVWTDEALLVAALRWRDAGMVDADYICRAKVIDADRSHGALVGPMVTHVQLTQQCNLRCKHCFVDIMAKRNPAELSADEMARLCDELESIGSPILVLAGGEPMMRPDFFEVLDVIEGRALDVWLCTNATLIDDDAAKRLARSSLRGLSISLDGPDEATHDFLRGRGQFLRAKRGIRAVVEAGQQDVKIRVTVTPHNVSRLEDFAPVARELGVHKVVFKPFRRNGLASDPSLVVPREQYFAAIDRLSRRWPSDAPPADLDDGMPSRPPEWTQIIPSFGCVGGTTLAVVAYDGRVVACGAILSGDDWNIRSRGFAEAWRRSPALAGWRSLTSSGECTSCNNFGPCGGGCRARAVGGGATMKDADPWAKCSEQKSHPALRVIA